MKDEDVKMLFHYDVTRAMIICKKSQRMLMFWLIMTMPDSYIVRNNLKTRIRFREHIKREWNMEPYTHRTINEAFSGLAKNRRLLRAKQGIYLVNPLYYGRSNIPEEHALLVLQEMMNEFFDPEDCLIKD